MLFKKSNSRTKTLKTKKEYWEYWDIPLLIDDLMDAYNVVTNYKGGYSNNFQSAQEFAETLHNEIESIKKQDYPDLINIWIWFAPTGDWDDIVGNESSGIGDRIFEKVSLWRKAGI